MGLGKAGDVELASEGGWIYKSGSSLDTWTDADALKKARRHSPWRFDPLPH